MPNLMPSNILQEVREVLLVANCGDRNRPQFMTAYQILDRLPENISSILFNERGLPGQGAGASYSSASVCSDAAEMLEGIEVSYIDCQGMTFQVRGQNIVPSVPACGIYKLGNI